MENLSNIPTKELKQQLDGVLKNLEYASRLSELESVAPYLVELFKRGYVSTVRFALAPDNVIGGDDGELSLTRYGIPSYVAYQTPFSKEVNYRHLVPENEGYSQEGLQYAKCYPNGKCEGGGFLDASGSRTPRKWVNASGSDDKLPLSFLLANSDVRPVYALSTFDNIYEVARDTELAYEDTGDQNFIYKLKVLSDEEVAELFKIPLSDAKYYFVLGLREPRATQALQMNKEKFDASTEPSKGLFSSLRFAREDLSTMKIGEENAREYVDSLFDDFRGLIPNASGTWYYLQDGVNVNAINKSDFDKKYSRIAQESSKIEPKPKTSEAPKAPKPKSNVVWWIVGGVAVSSAVYFAHSRRKSSY